jgi:adenylate cyclase class 2
MAIEIEKKYRLTQRERDVLIKRLEEVTAQFCGEAFEENTLYSGGVIDLKNCVLRLRRVGGKAILTYKERLQSSSAIKQQREDESEIEDADAMASILQALGYKPAIVYEKRRATWRVANTEVVIDELPFGLYLEIEGEEDDILKAETLLGLVDVSPEMATYPQLTLQHGKQSEDVIEARF